MGGNFEQYTKLKNNIALLKLLIGSSVGGKVFHRHSKSVRGISLSHFSDTSLASLHLVFEESVQLIKSYTVKISCLFGCYEKPTPFKLKMIHKLRVDLYRCHRHRNHVHVIASDSSKSR
ncbi:hypothetical protein Tco_0931856 [Tanacetum coccineum]